MFGQKETCRHVELPMYRQVFSQKYVYRQVKIWYDNRYVMAFDSAKWPMKKQRQRKRLNEP